jgi:hypothetical protein
MLNYSGFRPVGDPVKALGGPGVPRRALRLRELRTKIACFAAVRMIALSLTNSRGYPGSMFARAARPREKNFPDFPRPMFLAAEVFFALGCMPGLQRAAVSLVSA